MFYGNYINNSVYDHKMAMCIPMDHSGACDQDVRLERPWNKAYTNIRDMPCGSLQISATYDGSECTLIRGLDH